MVNLFRRGQSAREQAGRTVPLLWVTADLAVAGAPAPRDWPALRRAGICSVLDLRAEAADDLRLLEGLGLGYIRFPIVEGAAPTPEQLSAMVQWVAARIPSGPVLAHCREGRGRSPLAAAATLVHLGFSVADAYQLVRRAQPLAELSLEQARALESFGSSRGFRAGGG